MWGRAATAHRQASIQALIAESFFTDQADMGAGYEINTRSGPAAITAVIATNQYKILGLEVLKLFARYLHRFPTPKWLVKVRHAAVVPHSIREVVEVVGSTGDYIGSVFVFR